jgi:hypothetical protein
MGIDVRADFVAYGKIKEVFSPRVCFIISGSWLAASSVRQVATTQAHGMSQQADQDVSYVGP